MQWHFIYMQFHSKNEQKISQQQYKEIILRLPKGHYDI